MTVWIDTKYINTISSRLQLFKRKSENLWNFRCPFCGDSQKKKHKCRGYLYTKNGTVSYSCHNCGVGLSLANFFKRLDMSIFKDYQMEMFINGNDKQSTNPCPAPNSKMLSVKTNTKSRLSVKSKVSGLPTIYSLALEHPAREYLSYRGIVGSNQLKNLYLAEDYKEYADTHFKKYTNIIPEMRIVIPFKKRDGTIFAVQGRLVIPNNNSLRYITLKECDDVKVYGLNDLDYSRTVHICEGAFDSMFVDNCIAMGGADIDGIRDILPDIKSENLVFIFDNEPRNAEIVKRMDKIISKGFSIVIWPNTFIYNDINESIVDGLTEDDVNAIINTNTYSSMQAKIKISEWRRL